jgi:hypothetical protein
LSKSIATQCPICSGELVIGRLCCTSCDSRIETELPFDPLMRLPEEMRQFVLVFMRCRGNIRDVEAELGISYPTVCKKLDQVNELLAAKTSAAGQNGKAASPNGAKRLNRAEILERLERGEITAKDAAGLLKGR